MEGLVSFIPQLKQSVDPFCLSHEVCSGILDLMNANITWLKSNMSSISSFEQCQCLTFSSRSYLYG